MRILTVLLVLGLGVTRSFPDEESPLDIIRRGQAPNPSDMDPSQRGKFVQIAREGKIAESFSTKYECIRFLVDAGDKETIRDVLNSARDYTNTNIHSALEAWDYFDRSTNPDLIQLFDEDIHLDEPPGLAAYANGECWAVTRSSKASRVMFSIILNSRAFPAAVFEWAVKMKALFEEQRKYESVRNCARLFLDENREILRAGRFGDAVVPKADSAAKGKEEPVAIAVAKPSAQATDALPSHASSSGPDKTSPPKKNHHSYGRLTVFGAAALVVLVAAALALRIRKASPPPTPRG